MVRTRGGLRRNQPEREESDAERTESDEREETENEDEVGDEVEREDEDMEEALSPVRFYFKHPKWLDICKLATRCDLRKTVDLIERKLDGWELDWFKNHPQFRHYFHMPRPDNRRVMGMWMLLLRTAKTDNTKQCWFVVNGVPICYSIAEHALLSGLNCKAYPEGYNQFGSNELVERVFNRNRRIDVIDIRRKLESMDANGEDRLKVAMLYFLTTVLKGKSKIKRGYVEPFLLRVVDNLDVCQTFPWGTFSFLNIMEEINHLMEHFEGQVQGSWTSC